MDDDTWMHTIPAWFFDDAPAAEPELPAVSTPPGHPLTIDPALVPARPAPAPLPPPVPSPATSLAARTLVVVPVGAPTDKAATVVPPPPPAPRSLLSAGSPTPALRLAPRPTLAASAPEPVAPAIAPTTASVPPAPEPAPAAVSAPPAPQPAPSATAPAVSVNSSIGPPPPIAPAPSLATPAKRRLVGRTAAVVLVLGAVAGGGFLWRGQHDEPATASMVDTPAVSSRPTPSTTAPTTTTTIPVTATPATTTTAAPVTTTPPVETSAPTTAPPETVPPTPLPIDSTTVPAPPATATTMPREPTPYSTIAPPVAGVLPDVTFARPQLPAAEWDDTTVLLGYTDGAVATRTLSLSVEANYEPRLAHLSVATVEDERQDVRELFVTPDSQFEPPSAPGGAWQREQRSAFAGLDEPAGLRMYQDVVTPAIRQAATNTTVAEGTFGLAAEPVLTYEFDVPMSAFADSGVDAAMESWLSPTVTTAHMIVTIDANGLVRASERRLDQAAWANVIALAQQDGVFMPVSRRYELPALAVAALPISLPESVDAAGVSTGTGA